MTPVPGTRAAAGLATAQRRLADLSRAGDALLGPRPAAQFDSMARDPLSALRAGGDPAAAIAAVLPGGSSRPDESPRVDDATAARSPHSAWSPSARARAWPPREGAAVASASTVGATTFPEDRPLGHRGPAALGAHPTPDGATVGWPATVEALVAQLVTAGRAAAVRVPGTGDPTTAPAAPDRPGRTLRSAGAPPTRPQQTNGAARTETDALVARSAPTAPLPGDAPVPRVATGARVPQSHTAPGTRRTAPTGAVDGRGAPARATGGVDGLAALAQRWSAAAGGDHPMQVDWSEPGDPRAATLPERRGRAARAVDGRHDRDSRWATAGAHPDRDAEFDIEARLQRGFRGLLEDLLLDEALGDGLEVTR